MKPSEVKQFIMNNLDSNVTLDKTTTMVLDVALIAGCDSTQKAVLYKLLKQELDRAFVQGVSVGIDMIDQLNGID